MKWGKTDLIKRTTDVVRKGWSNVHVRDLIESLWRDPYSMRTSGFVTEGGPDADISLEVIETETDGVITRSLSFTIQPVGKKFHFYYFRETLSYHKKYAAETISFDAEEGLHAIYYEFDDDSSGQILKHILNPTEDEFSELFRWVVPIVFIYWDAERNEVTYYGDNRHGSWWNPWMHHVFHRSINSLREHGLRFTDILADEDGSSDTHAQFGVSEGSCWHDDIHAVSEAVEAPASFPVWYFNGSGQPRIWEPSVNCLVNDGLLCYNQGGAVTAAGEGKFVLLHVFYTNCIYNKFIAVMGQAQYSTSGTANYMIESELEQVKQMLPHQNLLWIGSLIYETSETFTNRYHARIVLAKAGGETASVIEDIAWDFNDVVAGSSQTYFLDVKVSFPYRILSCVLQSDSTMDDVDIQINSTAVTGLDNLDVTASVQDWEATGNNETAEGDQVKLVTSGTDGTPTLIRGKIRIMRL